MKSHLDSYPCPLNLNYFWNLGFLLVITILLQMITGILLSLDYTSDIHSAYYSVIHIIREIYYGWCLRSLHSLGAPPRIPTTHPTAFYDRNLEVIYI